MESTATGHQRSESVMNRTLYLKHQREKLKKQEERPEPPTSTPTSSAKPPSKIQLSGSASSASTNSSAGAAKADEPPKTKKLVMAGVRVYINGYLCDTTDIEMKRTVTLAGGQVLLVPSPFNLPCPSIRNTISYAIQSNPIQRDAHPDVTRPERFKVPQAPNQELENKNPHRETRVGC